MDYLLCCAVDANINNCFCRVEAECVLLCSLKGRLLLHIVLLALQWYLPIDTSFMVAYLPLLVNLPQWWHRYVGDIVSCG